MGPKNDCFSSGTPHSFFWGGLLQINQVLLGLDYRPYTLNPEPRTLCSKPMISPPEPRPRQPPSKVRRTQSKGSVQKQAAILCTPENGVCAGFGAYSFGFGFQTINLRLQGLRFTLWNFRILVSMDFSVGLGLTACDFVDPSNKC